MTITLREFQPSDYDAVVALWRASPGVTLRDVDTRAPLLDYLSRNAGLSFVACADATVIGAVLCGTDGRRGYLQHLAVDTAHQQQGIGRRLAERCVAALAERGIAKCHLMVVAGNDRALAFWTKLGWISREDVRLMSHTLTEQPNA